MMPVDPTVHPSIGAQSARFGAKLSLTFAETGNPTPLYLGGRTWRRCRAQQGGRYSRPREGASPPYDQGRNLAISKQVETRRRREWEANKNPGREGGDHVPAPPRIVDLVAARLPLSSSFICLPPRVAWRTLRTRRSRDPSHSQSFAAASCFAVSPSPVFF